MIGEITHQCKNDLNFNISKTILLKDEYKFAPQFDGNNVISINIVKKTINNS